VFHANTVTPTIQRQYAVIFQWMCRYKYKLHTKLIIEKLQIFKPVVKFAIFTILKTRQSRILDLWSIDIECMQPMITQRGLSVCLSECLSRACAPQKPLHGSGSGWRLVKVDTTLGPKGSYSSRTRCGLRQIIFLPPDAVRWRVICYGDVAVCVSVTLMYCTKTTESIIVRPSPDCRSAILAFPDQIRTR